MKGRVKAMGKFCKTYKVPCTSAMCNDTDCARAPETRAEAEVLRGVRLTADGRTLEDAGAPVSKETTQRDKPAVAPPPAKDEAPPAVEVEKEPAVVELKSMTVPASILLRQPARRAAARDLFAPGFLIFGAVACAGLLLVATYFAIEYFKPKDVQPAPVLVEEVDVPSPPPQSEQKQADGPAAAAAAPQETLTIDDVMAALKSPPPAITELPPPSPKEDLAAKVDKMRDEGNKLVKKRDYAAARESYQAAVEADPLYYQGWNNLANTFSDEGRPMEAEPIYRRGLAIQPTSTNLRFNLGNAHYRAGRYEEAIAELNLVLQQNPNDIDAHQLSGVANYKLGRYKVAAEHFQVVTVMNPESADGFYNLALALRKQGQDALAGIYYRDALRLNPDIRTLARN